MLVLMLLLSAEGQVAKFDHRSPEAHFAAAGKLEDLERCLVRSGSPPQVYRQPDRPDDVTLVWTAAGLSAGNAAARIDLHRASPTETDVTAWGLADQVRACAENR